MYFFRKSVQWAVATLFMASLLAVLDAVFLNALAQDSPKELSGREIMKRQSERHNARSEYGSWEMLLINKVGEKKKRKLNIYLKDKKEDAKKILIRFLYPKDIKGTGLLTWDDDEDQVDQWLYLPAFRKIKRIASENRRLHFAGTEFSYEDLRPENLDKYIYQRRTGEKINGHDCYKIVATAKREIDRRQSGYSRRELWVRKDIFFIARINYYDLNGKLAKELYNYVLEKVAAEMYRPKRIEMHNLVTSRRTIMTNIKMKINGNIPDRKFTRKELKSGQE
jgi:hypothetical protein